VVHLLNAYYLPPYPGIYAVRLQDEGRTAITSIDWMRGRVLSYVTDDHASATNPIVTGGMAASWHSYAKSSLTTTTSSSSLPRSSPSDSGSVVPFQAFTPGLTIVGSAPESNAMVAKMKSQLATIHAMLPFEKDEVLSGDLSGSSPNANLYLPLLPSSIVESAPPNSAKGIMSVSLEISKMVLGITNVMDKFIPDFVVTGNVGIEWVGKNLQSYLGYSTITSLSIHASVASISIRTSDAKQHISSGRNTDNRRLVLP